MSTNIFFNPLLSSQSLPSLQWWEWYGITCTLWWFRVCSLLFIFVIYLFMFGHATHLIGSIPWLRIERGPQQWMHWILTTRPSGDSHCVLLKGYFQMNPCIMLLPMLQSYPLQYNLQILKMAWFFGRTKNICGLILGSAVAVLVLWREIMSIHCLSSPLLPLPCPSPSLPLLH